MSSTTMTRQGLATLRRNIVRYIAQGHIQARIDSLFAIQYGSDRYLGANDAYLGELYEAICGSIRQIGFHSISQMTRGRAALYRSYNLYGFMFFDESEGETEFPAGTKELWESFLENINEDWAMRR